MTIFVGVTLKPTPAMAFFRLEEKHIRPVVFAATGLFLCLAILYFSPADIPHKISFALATLFVASLWLVPWPMSMALLFSALGDYAGSCGIFLAQMGFFAVAHIFMIGFFVCRWIRKVEPDKKLTAKAKGQAFIFLLMTLALLGFVFTKVVPCAPEGIIRTGTGIYAILISSMLFFALLQRSSLYALGAVLFVFSDFILAWNKFVEPVEYSRYLIMVPYYLGQWLLFVRSTPYRIRTNLRTMRF